MSLMAVTRLDSLRIPIIILVILHCHIIQRSVNHPFPKLDIDRCFQILDTLNISPYPNVKSVDKVQPSYLQLQVSHHVGLNMSMLCSRRPIRNETTIREECVKNYVPKNGNALTTSDFSVYLRHLERI
jgi:hypothetical protein